jgi:nitroreductase
MAWSDFARFRAAAAPAGYATNEKNLRALVMYYTHSVEKGLSRRDFRPGFGEKAVSALAQQLNEWARRGLSAQDEFVQSALETMRAYVDRHEEIGVDVSERLAVFDVTVREQIFGAEPGGGVRRFVEPVGAAGTFAELARNRVSLREFAAGEVPIAIVERAMSLALTSPSACNRQSSRVHVVTESRQIDELLRIQAGLGGYRRPPLLLLVTSDASSYVEATERNQPFVDGALFTMTLIYALEAEGFGTCALTASLWGKNERAVRAALGIPDTEFLITFVAVGRKPADALVPISKRSSVDAVLTVHGEASIS